MSVHFTWKRMETSTKSFNVIACEALARAIYFYAAQSPHRINLTLQKIGLHGKSFLPMIVGFGCSVPGIYATRTLENEKDRILTGLLVPFMSCGARLPVYVLFATIFFPKQMGLVIFGLYMTGILVAIVLNAAHRIIVGLTTIRAPPNLELHPFLETHGVPGESNLMIASGGGETTDHAIDGRPEAIRIRAPPANTV